MKIAVTGANGYIGQEVVAQLKQKQGVELKCIDIDTWDIRKPPKDGSGIEQHWLMYDVVIHLAALVKVGESVNKPWDYYNTNITGTRNVIEAFPGAKFIFASTGAAFDPASPYARSKIAAEDIVKELCDEYTIFRFFNVGGGEPNNPEGLYQATKNAIESGTFTIFGNDYDTPDGTCVRDYVHVKDLAAAIVSAVNQKAAMTDYEPIGSGKSYTVKQYVDTFLKVNGPLFKVEYGPRREGDAASTEVPFMSKFMAPTHTLEDIVRLK